jgi:hypothetical protein
MTPTAYPTASVRHISAGFIQSVAMKNLDMRANTTSLCEKCDAPFMRTSWDNFGVAWLIFYQNCHYLDAGRT